MQFSDFPPPRFSSIFKKGKKTGVVACGAQTRLEREQPFFRVDEGNDSKT